MGKKLELENLNENLLDLKNDYLYHINLEKNKIKLKAAYGDVKFVCMGGTSKRMFQFAVYMKDILEYSLPAGLTFHDITESGDRYSIYKLGSVLFVNHGIGCASLSVVLNEVIKLLYYAECKDVTFFRVGTCGGIGIEPGTLVLTEEAVDGLFRPEYRQIILGKEVTREAKCDKSVINSLIEMNKSLKKEDQFKIVSGKTLCADGFYEEQGRLDGVFCEYKKEEKIDFLKKCKENNILNIEMESLCFAATLNHAKIKFAIVCASLLDRLVDDQIVSSHDLIVTHQQQAFKLVGQYIKNQLELSMQDETNKNRT